LIERIGTMATSTRTVDAPRSAEKPIPPLRNGDHLDGEEFLRRYEAMPHLKKAELIDGRVYIDSPVSFEEHSAPHFDLITWMGIYRSATPGIRGGDNGTVRLAPKTMPQADALLLILPSHSGQTRIGADKFVQGAPELVVEVAYSSVSYDLHEKLEVYRLHGASEYLVWRVEDESIEWFALVDGRFVRLEPGEDGLLKSVVFPGLWLDPIALIVGDMERVVRVVQQGIASPEHVEFIDRLRNAARPK
jgi:Uma2 family endonuclease